MGVHRRWRYRVFTSLMGTSTARQSSEINSSARFVWGKFSITEASVCGTELTSHILPLSYLVFRRNTSCTQCNIMDFVCSTLFLFLLDLWWHCNVDLSQRRRWRWFQIPYYIISQLAITKKVLISIQITRQASVTLTNLKEGKCPCVARKPQSQHALQLRDSHMKCGSTGECLNNGLG